MCGRKYGGNELTWAEYRKRLILTTSPPETNFAPNYNIAPTHMVPVCHMSDGARVLELLSWGLVPSWAKDKKIGYKMINARAETLAEKPSFSPLLKSNRCIIPVSGFYEWKRNSKTDKQAFAIHRKDKVPLLMAGLWTTNKQLGISTYVVITRPANDYIDQIHNRMPVMMNEDQVLDWLEKDWPSASSLLSDEVAYEQLEASPVSNDVGKVSNNYEDLMESIGPAL